MSESSGYGNSKYGTSPLGSGDPQDSAQGASETGYGQFGYGSGPLGSSLESASIEVEVFDTLSATDTVTILLDSSLVSVVVSDTATTGTDSLEIDILLRVATASSTGKNNVLITFSNDLNTSYGPLSNVSNYLLNPALTILSAQIVGLRQVLLQTSDQSYVPYTVTVFQAESLTNDLLGPLNTVVFQGFSTAPTFEAGALSPTKVALEFSSHMEINSQLINASNYTVTANLGGVSIPITSVAVVSFKRVELTLGATLSPQGYYAVTVGPLVLSNLGVTPQPNVRIFKWDFQQPPSKIAISDFSGEISGGLLGTPEGQVFFSPALMDETDSPSTIEVEEISVCTRAYDEYLLPKPPRVPSSLFTYAPGAVSSLLGQDVLWGSPLKLGHAKTTLRDLQSENVFSKVFSPSTSTMDSPIGDYAAGILRETIDITRAAFLNDPRWKTYPNTGAFVFRTADNGTPISAGPTTAVKLSTVKSVQVSDAVTVSDSPSVL